MELRLSLILPPVQLPLAIFLTGVGIALASTLAALR
jgi:hypothetical protein